jgi:hypothetical protein
MGRFFSTSIRPIGSITASLPPRAMTTVTPAIWFRFT